MVSFTDLLDPLLEGSAVTLEVTALSAALGGLVAFVTGLGRLANNPILRIPAAVFIEFFRGTSALVLMFWLFFALPLLGLTLDPLTAGVLALGLNYGAYGAEVVRGAVLQVPQGQIEAGIALNYSRAQRLRLVVLPQALRGMLPPLNNLLVDLLKSTSLVSLVTLSDLTFRARQQQEAVGHTVEIFLLLLLFYFVMCFGVTRLMRLLERRVSRHLCLDAATFGAPR